MLETNCELKTHLELKGTKYIIHGLFSDTNDSLINGDYRMEFNP